MPEFPTQTQGSFVGGKEGGSFEKGGEKITYAPKLQFLLSAASGEAELLPISEDMWNKADGSPPISSLEHGQEFLLAGAVVLRGREGWFSLRRVEQV